MARTWLDLIGSEFVFLNPASWSYYLIYLSQTLHFPLFVQSIVSCHINNIIMCIFTAVFDLLDHFQGVLYMSLLFLDSCLFCLIANCLCTLLFAVLHMIWVLFLFWGECPVMHKMIKSWTINLMSKYHSLLRTPKEEEELWCILSLLLSICYFM